MSSISVPDRSQPLAPATAVSSPPSPEVADARAGAWRLAAPERPRAEAQARLRAHGPCALDDAETLALVGGLQVAAAQDLIARFGSLPEVMGAAAVDLAGVAGRSAAERLVLARDLARRHQQAALRRRSVVSSSAALMAYLRTQLAGRPSEEVRVLFLDTRNQLIADESQGPGTVDAAPLYVREVVSRALRQPGEPAQEKHIPQVARKAQDYLLEKQELGLVGRRARHGGILQAQGGLRPDGLAAMAVARDIEGDAHEERAGVADPGGRRGGPRIGLLRHLLGDLAAEVATEQAQEAVAMLAIDGLELFGDRHLDHRNLGLGRLGSRHGRLD